MYYSTFLHVVNQLRGPGRAQLWRRPLLAQSFHPQPVSARRSAPGGSRPPIRTRAGDGGQSGAPLLYDGLLSLSTGFQLTTATVSVIRQRSNIWRQREDCGESSKVLPTQTQTSFSAYPSTFCLHIWRPRRAQRVPGPCCCSPVEAVEPLQGYSSPTQAASNVSFAGVGSASSRRGGQNLRSLWVPDGMTALAGSIARMMRPTLAQNYPRSGFPLEGKASHRQ